MVNRDLSINSVMGSFHDGLQGFLLPGVTPALDCGLDLGSHFQLLDCSRGAGC